MIYENIFNIIIHAYYYSIRSTLVEYYIYIYIHSRYKYKFYALFLSKPWASALFVCIQYSRRIVLTSSSMHRGKPVPAFSFLVTSVRENETQP